MSEKEVQESQKTVVAFIAGLLVGGLLVWVFSSNPEKVEAPDKDMEQTESEVTETNSTTEATTEETVANLPVGEGKVSIANQPAGSLVRLQSATFPTEEGWVAVRDYNNGQMGYVLGAIQYSKAANRVPTEIPLLTPTVAGRTYAIVFFSQDSNRAFNLDGDVQLNTALTTFEAE